MWIKAINRENFTPNEHTCICSEHFEGGWHWYEREDANYAPTIFNYKETAVDPKRQERATRRNLQQEFEEMAKKEKEYEDKSKTFSLMSHSYCKNEEEEYMSDDQDTCSMPSSYHHDHDDVDMGTSFSNTGTQCDPDRLLIENQRLSLELKTVKAELLRHKWSVGRLKNPLEQKYPDKNIIALNPLRIVAAEVRSKRTIPSLNWPLQ
ncbi:hypothetical protein FSP39_003384 [Pinctada imbricata]|uniref:THAP-type domain-containing protein n=1 Tax=Pinctada imbricata TaxID=66713 RepID=A0AA89BYJ3_PINIB|nr:hypothetical protein FSP39_003384 [Pinctada imbricata]